ncbi:xanthine dehydrogenase family protein molybdopterin-binding subunit [Cryptosporangium phraense]|uniref:Xanthine dehydrogenase family protein molybdopterin-binding subunit n=1 Tax=Cryptosporangium phraense TaxID=2593070 RepID=A0A545AYX6_9ACTN|nr:xanthine dehydrogenase family protein molybdopterin-binding subunit [Cryptosporangium phraense]
MTPTRTASIGTPVARIEGPLKVTGTARYAVEYPVENVAYAWVVQAPIARGHVVSIEPGDDDGLLALLWHGNAPRLESGDDPELQVLQSPRISYRGQVVALAVARTLEAARRAAQSVRMELVEEEHDAELTPDHPGLYTPEKVNPAFPSDTSAGDVDAALAAAAATVDVTYSTPALHNNPMEPHATTAMWVGDDLVLYDSNQGPSAIASQVAKVFSLKRSQIHVIAEHVGGGFGSKGSARPNAILAAMAARVVGTPVRLALPRQALFTMVGHRTPTIQRVRLGASADGKLTAIAHDVVEQTSRLFEFAEQTAVVTRHMYAAPNRRTSHRLARLDMPTPRWMRAPGEAPGMVALEGALDELAVSLGIDPIELRIRNEPDVEPEDGTPFSSRHYVECLRLGASRFGWAGRSLEPRQRREGRWWVGTGMAGATYPSMVMPSTATVRIDPERRVEVTLAAVDIGTGSRTVLHQIAADGMGVPLENVTVRIGDSGLTRASIAGGSSGSASWGWAIDGACRLLREELSRLTGPVPPDGLSATFDTTPDVKSRENSGKHAFGAHFAEVRVDADTGEVRVSRLLGAYAVGRVLNPRTARSQFIGGMTMGMGMALHEESVLDASTGDWVNHDLAEYHVPVHADVESIEAVWIDEEDLSVNPLGVKGIGEIGIVGSPAAIVNAVWHATGVRVRDLPVRLDKLLGSL